MSSIVPGQIERLRKEKNLTQTELAKRVNVDQKTIWRLEKGTHKRKIRPPIVEALAKALDTTVERLVGAPPTKPADDENSPTTKSADDENSWTLIGLPTQLNVRIDNASRNAFALVCKRYQIPPYKLVSLAPLLFVCAAEKSLIRRRERLGELQKRQQDVEALYKDFEHLNALIWNNVKGEQTIFEEQDSINAHDIFGAMLDSDGPEDHLPYKYDEDKQNPFAIFLRDLSKESNGMAEFFSLGPGFSVPRYKLNIEFLHYLVGDDEDAADEILLGHLALSSIPKDFTTTDERLAWIKDHRAKRLEKFADLDEILNSTSISPTEGGAS
jgi:transcriptional regulator with XRE-family HTH domain